MLCMVRLETFDLGNADQSDQKEWKKHNEKQGQDDRDSETDNVDELVFDW